MPLLTIKDLSIGYDGKTVAGNLSFTVNAGDYLCILGENGSGKTTLMNTLLGLSKQLAGEIIVGDGLRKNEIGYLPQQTLVQRDFPASVKEIVLSGCQGRLNNRPFYNKEDRRLAESNMKRMGIDRLSRKCYRELSGGQQQRVLLARALCATGKLLLLDEPVSGLDPKAAQEMYNIIERLNKEGITVIMISHDVSKAVSTASHILYIGAEIFFGTVKEYLDSKYGKIFVQAEGNGIIC